MANPGNRTLFRQNDFSGGMNAQLDAAKTPDNSYPVLVNGRTRRNVISPTSRHIELAAPEGNKQGIYIAGSFLVLFVSGNAYYANIETSPIIFYPVLNWTQLDPDVSRIYAELVPATSNLFNRAGTVDESSRTFNNLIAVFEQALFCFDGINDPQAILPNGSAVPLGTYASWTKDNPLYVPKGVLPAFASSKLFLADPDLQHVLSSVSGRCSDFVVNLDASGDKGGDASTVSQTVSFNKITAIRSISTGEVLVGTLYGTSVLVLDPTRPQFGEPYLDPRFLFPAGPVNELSIVDILSDTAMITQSGIHAFNAVAQAKRESNNFPFGAKIRGIITNPITEKAIVQENTCASLYDDYAFFAVNTVFGYGVLVFDTTTQSFQALDLSFGRVKQFANTRITGNERLFFITADNKIFEAFASDKKNSTRVLLGEWTPPEAPSQIVSYMVDMIFANVRESGQVKISVYADRELKESVVLNVTAGAREVSLPIPLPFITGNSVASSGFHFAGRARAWKLSAMIEWNFAGELTDFSVDGQLETADNIRFTLPDKANEENLVFIADSGYSDELNPGGNFTADGFLLISVTQNCRYCYFANGNGPLANGNQVITEGIFTAASSTVVIQGTGPALFSLRTAENYMNVLTAIDAEKDIKAILHGGDFAYPSGTELDVQMAKLPIKKPLFITPGNHDVVTDSGKFFFNLLKTPRYFVKTFEFVDLFFFNSETADEPDGTTSTSLQTGILKNWLRTSTKPFKILITHEPPYTNDINHYPGRTDLRYLLELPGLSAIIAGHGHVMERFVINSFPEFVCGAGGASLRSFQPNTTSAFRNDSQFGYLLLHADALTCQISFKDVDGTVLDSYALYA